MSRANSNRSGGVQWSDGALKRLVDAYNEGNSAGVVAKAFGVTRNTVVGQINRAKRRGWTVRKGSPTNSHWGTINGVRKAKPRRATTARRPMRPSSPADKRKATVSLPDTAATHCDLPIPAAHPAAAGDISQTNAGLAVSSLEASASAPAPDTDASAPDPGAFSPGVPLEDVGPKQCRFPLWPHKAKPGAPGYGVVCGAPVEVSKTTLVPLYCEHHRRRCSDGKPKRSTKASASRLKLPHLKPQVAR